MHGVSRLHDGVALLLNLAALALFCATTASPSPAATPMDWLTIADPYGVETAETANATGPRATTFAALDLGEDFRSSGRIHASHGSFHTHYQLDERRFGVALQPGYAMIAGGKVVEQAFAGGPSITLRLIANVSGANSFYLDFDLSHHAMRDPKPMLFRTSVPSSASFSGQMTVIAPAIYYAFTIPIGEDFHHRAMFLPKLYLGVGPMYATSNGTVNGAGSKGTVSGHGTQGFFQFTPGIGVDFRVPSLDFFFVGVDLRYRISVPTERPNFAKEFTIPTLYILEPALNVAYMFY